jgi:hypothetical protein
MVMIEIKLNNSNRDDVLYYETGFEQMHPNPEIMKWAESQGWLYYKDWKCTKVPHTATERDYYKLSFATQEMASLFALKWM